MIIIRPQQAIWLERDHPIFLNLTQMDAILEFTHKVILVLEGLELKLSAPKHAGKLLIVLHSICTEEVIAIFTLRIIHADQTHNKTSTIWTGVKSHHLHHLSHKLHQLSLLQNLQIALNCHSPGQSLIISQELVIHKLKLLLETKSKDKEKRV